ncbi:MAG: patatin-like phospholipase family protein [Candidatus Yanofskybacteria bacterium]|nr:patatin-like phospholipase family protein [Candidatus Yanofskybacteria bacterium]
MRILVLDGGGQLGAFQWGAMTELHRQGIDYHFFDYYICTSSGAFNAAYFLTEQMEEGKRNWLKNLSERFWKIFKNDMPALENILRYIEPLHCDQIKSRKQKIIVALSNLKTKKADYICLNEERDIIKALLACCAMPFFTKPGELHGNQYYDGSLIGQPQIDKAFSLGGAEIWIIMMQPPGYRLNLFYWKVFSWLSIFNHNLKDILVRCPSIRNDILQRIENNAQLKVIRPASTLPIDYRNKNLELIKRCYALGQTVASEFLKK